MGTVPLPGLSLATEAVTVMRGCCPCLGGDDHLFPKASLTFCRSVAILPLSLSAQGEPSLAGMVFEPSSMGCFNPIPLCVQSPSSQQSRSNPTPRLPTPLMRTSPLNVRPEETPSPREYCLEKQTEAESVLNLCQALLCLSGAAAQKTCSSSSAGLRFGFPLSFCCPITFPSPCE